VNGRIIKLICACFGVNEKWLLTGEGELFDHNPEKEYTKLLSLYKELTPEYQDLIIKQIDNLLEIQDKKSL
jgi:hypothetical protein